MMNQTLIRKSISSYLLFPGAAAAAAPKDAQAALGFSLDKDEWQRPQGYNNDGSLPNSQGELDEDDEDMDVDSGSRGSTSPPSTPTGSQPDSLYMETWELLHSLFREHAGYIKGSSGANPKALATLRRVGGEINDKHKMAFQGMLQRLSIETPDDIQKLSEVPHMVFNDGITNWGRIVTLISFGAFVAKHMKSIKLESGIRTLTDNFTGYLMQHKRDWIVEHNGWEGCVEFFHVEDYESGLRTVLMAFAGVAGLGASLAYMIR
ncbi:induced myeloid leukemia cell differentiation protein Mcl-1 [Hyperolius riggenbachi]|uniref:induced myeloid leukemia cell differentiation protein Mcl-1 n=1 Tax=Hyperolius riggenbachi TaxID=752182 RepID=UPI0035A2C6D5